ncbi:hypothetical protein [Polyangium aurulentum]|uniref:hypothetical protein n=1 Tax=Polyangium aurulentum TaxID=2567896 RepID=UPI0010AEDC71|nr:hypothetical protein [Polyangium aurulentum]UQA56944.1 hypothetical protein E8A73_037475 [Polyangium aurulentum]
MEEPPRSTGLARALLFATSLLQAAFGAAYALVQPRGFAVPSAAFFEHELLGPLFIVLGVATAVAVATRRATGSGAGLGAMAGLWFVVAAFGLATGTTHFASLLAFPCVGALLLFAVALRSVRAYAALASGALLGALLGAAFWASARAPRSSTRPLGSMLPAEVIPEAAPMLEQGALGVRLEGHRVVVEQGPHRAEILPGFDYDAVADGCGLTVLDFREARLPPFRAGRAGDRLLFAAESADFDTRGEVTIDAGTVRVRVTTLVERELCAHLGTAIAARIEGPARIGGFSWPSGGSGEPVHFAAFRGDTLAFLEASHDEKGPFEEHGTVERQEIEAGGWRIEVKGWDAQASKQPSPTAGWGVSQGAIEHHGDWFFWEIAATSIGRGWHTVRTAPGVYAFVVEVTRGGG